MQELSNVLAGKYEEIVEKITSFSNEYLNDEYKNLCIQAAKILFTNNEDQVKKGKSFSWAAGIVHAVGNVNNLFDAKNEPHMKALDLYKGFGVSSSTGSSKSKEVRALLGLDENANKWTIGKADLSAQKEAAVTAEKNEADSFRFTVSKKFVEAQRVVERAWNEKNYNNKAKYAKEALNIYEDCSDAYIILSKNSSLSNSEKKELLKRAVTAAQNVLKITELKDTDLRIFRLSIAEPFFGAKYTLALHLWNMNEREEAIENLNDVLTYDRKDNLLSRGILTSWLIIEGKLKEAEEILTRCEHDFLVDTNYNRAALLFKCGKRREAESALRRAYKRNPFVVDYLLKSKTIKSVKSSPIPGSQEEAANYAKLGLEVWNDAEMIKWLKSMKKDFEILHF